MSFNGRNLVLATLLAATGLGAACRRAIVIVPARDPGYTARDTLYGTRDGDRVRVTFRHDTTWRVDTVRRTDTLWRAGQRVDTLLLARKDTVVRVDTLRVASNPGPLRRVDTVRVVTRDTIRVIVRDTLRLGTVARDTIRIIVRDTVRIGTVARDTVRITVRDTLRLTVRDTVRITVRDTVHRVDTLRITTQRVDTVSVAGPRKLFVPPGQYPPAGQCRIWIYDVPPGQQARAAPCGELGAIPAGAFVLFNGEAWDFDYNWLASYARGQAPPQILALKRR